MSSIKPLRSFNFNKFLGRYLCLVVCRKTDVVPRQNSKDLDNILNTVKSDEVLINLVAFKYCKKCTHKHSETLFKLTLVKIFIIYYLDFWPHLQRE